MPDGEVFFNPYRFVTLPNKPVVRRAPAYHHRYSGQSGRAVCEVTTLTPLTISKGGTSGAFITRQPHPENAEEPYLPATSLKGMIRALVEVLGAAAVPFDSTGSVDSRHKPDQAASGSGTDWELDAVARTFGFLKQRSRDCFAGLVRFHDGFLKSQPETPPGRWLTENLLGTGPKPNHRPFYPAGQPVRKIYHHQPGQTHLQPPPAGTKATQTTQRQIAPPGTQFEFRVDFQNLMEDEIAWLVYALALEPEVTVTLSARSLGQKPSPAVTLTGPMRHKLGGGKAAGGGSVHIALTELTLYRPEDRYRSPGSQPPPRTGEAFGQFLTEQRQRAIALTDPNTLKELRAMMIYSPKDPRASDMHYPTMTWFEDRPKAELKPPT